MTQDREARIRERAYKIWEQGGREDGRDKEDWEKASREIDGESRTDDTRGGEGGEAVPAADGGNKSAQRRRGKSSRQVAAKSGALPSPSADRVLSHKRNSSGPAVVETR